MIINLTYAEYKLFLEEITDFTRSKDWGKNYIGRDRYGYLVEMGLEELIYDVTCTEPNDGPITIEPRPIFFQNPDSIRFENKYTPLFRLDFRHKYNCFQLDLRFKNTNELYVDIALVVNFNTNYFIYKKSLLLGRSIFEIINFFKPIFMRWAETSVFAIAAKERIDFIRSIKTPVPPSVLEAQAWNELQIHQDEAGARLQLRGLADQERNLATIQQNLRMAREEATVGILSERYIKNRDLINYLMSSHFKESIQDLPLLNQLAYFLDLYKDENSLFFLALITELIPPEIEDALVSITASNDILEVILNHMVFFSTDGTTCLVVSYDYFKKFILRQIDARLDSVQWSHIYIFHKTSAATPYINIPTRDLSVIFNLFPLFRAPYWASRNALIYKYINRIFSGYSLIFPSISAAINSPSSHLKLFDLPQQEQLILCFTPAFIVGSVNYENASYSNFATLKHKVLEDIFKIFEYSNNTNSEKNFLLFGLALFFVKLSSQQFVGTEFISPAPLRFFAVALLNRIGRDVPFFAEIQGWKNSLLGIGTAETCTNILAHIMHDRLAGTRPDIFHMVYPQAWR